MIRIPKAHQLIVTLVDAPLHAAAFQLNDDGTFTYTPENDAVDLDSFTYRVSDGELDSGVATVTIVFNAVPIAENDTVQTILNVPATINVLANDNDAEGMLDPTTVTIVKKPLRGAAKATASGQVIYTPTVGYVGNDSFTYTVKDNYGVVSNVATVSISVILDPFPWQNPINPLDVNNDGKVSPIDVLLVVSDINKNGSRNLPNPPIAPNTPPPFLDVSGDGRLSPVDALAIITFLNAPSGEGEGEGEARVVSSTSTAGPEPALFVPISAVSIGDQTSLTVTADNSNYRVAPGDTEEDFGLRIGTAQDVRQAALASYLSSSVVDEAVEDLVGSVRGLQDEEILEDQALTDLLFGGDNDK